MSLVSVMSKHANVAARGSRDQWSLTWHADRIEISFESMYDWNFFHSTFIPQCWEDLKERGLISDFELAKLKYLSDAEVEKMYEDIRRELGLKG